MCTGEGAEQKCRDSTPEASRQVPKVMGLLVRPLRRPQSPWDLTQLAFEFAEVRLLGLDSSPPRQTAGIPRAPTQTRTALAQASPRQTQTELLLCHTRALLSPSHSRRFILESPHCAHAGGFRESSPRASSSGMNSFKRGSRSASGEQCSVFTPDSCAGTNSVRAGARSCQRAPRSDTLRE